MQPLATIPFLGKKKKNNYWEGEHLHGNDSITRILQKYNDPNIKAAYLVGSLLELKGKEHYRREPNDMDIYIWTSEMMNKKDVDNLQEKIEKAIPLQLPVQLIDRTYHPFDAYANEGLDMRKAYMLYPNSP